MIRHNLIFGSILLVSLMGCSMPQTAPQFRDMMQSSMFGRVENLQVERPFPEVAKTFQDLAEHCLTVRTSNTIHTNRVNSIVRQRFKPTLHIQKNTLELHVQQTFISGATNLDEPEGGAYLVVADATPINRDHTQVDLYGIKTRGRKLYKAVRGWATGEVTGCPDLSK